MRNSFETVCIVAKRELRSYISTPLAAVFITIFVALAAAFTFYIGNFFERGQADLFSFFAYHPWLYLIFVPAVAMRLWSEERKTGTIELLMTLPISPVEAIIGKFIAAWLFIGVALLLTTPIWITVNLLGDPDNGVIITSYIGSFLMAGAFLAIGSFVSAMTKNQVIAFILGATICFFFTMSGLEFVQNGLSAWAPDIVSSTIRSMSFLSHYQGVTRGVVEAPTLLFFVSMIVFWLFATVIAIDQKKAA